MINILLIGGGAREHAIARAIKRSTQENAIFCFASNQNPGISKLSAQYQIGKMDQLEMILQFATQNKADFAIIGPEVPLALGLVDLLTENNISCIGPMKQVAQIESSKGFTRDLLTRFNVPASPRYKTFNSLDGMQAFLQELGQNFVVKAGGLIGGKGVKIAGEQLQNHEDALAFAQELLDKQHHVVIEEKIEGQEFSLLSFSDGTHTAPMPPVQDHKRTYENDLGPNTGGMGSYSDANHRLPFLNDDDIKQAQQLNQTVVEILAKDIGRPYKGILYGGFMLTKNGVKLIEYNARFGDPEAMNLLALLETDFIKICQSIIKGDLDTLPISFAHKATVCKYLVPDGYPDNPTVNGEIDLSRIDNDENLYYSAVNAKDGKLHTTTSRAIAVLGIANTLSQAEKEAESIIRSIKGPLFHRKDIGTVASLNKKIAHINRICGRSYDLLVEPLKIAVLASGRGSILPKLIKLLKEKQIPARITLIISNKSDAPVLELGAQLHIETLLEKSEEAILKILEQQQIDLILLVGYMRILSKEFIEHWQNKILNVHPSLLPAFAGLMDLKVHQAVLEAGVKETGCTVHFIDETIDGGPILVQKSCEVKENDTPDTLKQRVQNLESEAFVEAIQQILNER